MSIERQFELAEENKKLKAEVEEWIQAVGLASTALPNMIIDVKHPIEMMQKVVTKVAEQDREIAEAREEGRKEGIDELRDRFFMLLGEIDGETIAIEAERLKEKGK
ncbi:MAG: hypothetical protein ABIG39_06705 [Candidatus Micrarchaeota archaeon]